MQGLIHIGLGHRDIVFEASRYRRIHLMDDAQRCIAVLYRVHDDPYREQVIDLVHRLILIDHLLVNAEKMLDTPVHIRFDAGVLHVGGHFIHDLLDEFFPLRLPCVNLIYKVKEYFRLRILKSQVIQFRLNLGYAEPLGNRRIDIHGLFGFLLLLGRRHKLQRAHVVKAVGKLDNDDPDILCHCQEHLS